MMVFCGKGKMDGYFLTRSLILENFEKQRARHYQREIFLFFSVKISVEFSAIVSSFLSLHGFLWRNIMQMLKDVVFQKPRFHL